MAIKGVNPSYFAGMPEVALDPKASKANPQYAQMLSQAMQNQAAATDKRRESDEDNAFKARTQDQQERRDRMSNEISKRNTAVNEAGEARLKGEQDIKNDHLKSADTRDLIEAAHRAKEAKDQVAYDFLNSELEKRGVNVRSKQESDEDFATRMNRAPQPAPPAPPAAPPVDRSPMPPRSPPPTASFPPAGGAEAAPPMRAAPAGPLPRSTASFPPTNGAPPPGPAPAPRPAPSAAAAAPPRAAAPASPGWPAPPPPTDDSAFFQAPFDQAGLEAGLDKVMPTDQQVLNAYIGDSVRREKAGLPAIPYSKGLLPGKTLRRRAAESDLMLSPDDPLLKPRAQ